MAMLESLRLTLERRRGRRSSVWRWVAGASAIGAAVVGGLIWRLIAGTSSTDAPDRLAAATASSVAEAAHQLMINAADDHAEQPANAVRAAAASAIAEAAAAGADVTAAAHGAVQGAREVAAGPESEGVMEAAMDGLREAASEVGPAARARIDNLLESLSANH